MHYLARLAAAVLCIFIVTGCGGGGGPSSSEVEKLRKEAGPNYIQKMNMGEDDPPASAAPNQ